VGDAVASASATTFDWLVVFGWRLVAVLVALPGGGAYIISRRTNSL
jgi:hypothetical protein